MRPFGDGDLADDRRAQGDSTLSTAATEQAELAIEVVESQDVPNVVPGVKCRRPVTASVRSGPHVAEKAVYPMYSSACSAATESGTVRPREPTWAMSAAGERAGLV